MKSRGKRKQQGRRGAPRKLGVGQRLIRGMRELDDWLASAAPLTARFTVNTVADVPEPAEYDAKRIANVRHRIGASQAVFARLVGVSTPLVCAWERGGRRPSAMARRLLDEISRDPDRWSALLGAQQRRGSAA